MPDILRDALKEAYSKMSPSDALVQLKRLLTPPKDEGEEVVPDWPNVATPPQFKPYPDVIGDRGLYNNVRGALRLSPSLQGHIGRVQNAPTSAVFREMARGKISPYDYLDTNLLGATDISKEPRDVYIHPSQGQETLMHELSHVAGYGEPGAQETEAAFNRAYPPREDPNSPLSQLVNVFKGMKGVTVKVGE